MFNFMITPNYTVSDKGHLFDVILNWTEYNEEKKVKLSELIYSDDIKNPQRRAEIQEAALRGFSFFGAMLGRVKETITQLELRFERWEANIRPIVQKHIRDTAAGKPTKDDIHAGMLSLNAIVVPHCSLCEGKTTHFLVYDNIEEKKGCYKQKNKYLMFLCMDCFEKAVVEKYSPEEIYLLPPYLDSALVSFEEDFIYTSSLSKLGYVITDYVPRKYTVYLGDIWESFQENIRHFESFINSKNNSRGSLEIIVRAFERARDTNTDILRQINSDWKMNTKE